MGKRASVWPHPDASICPWSLPWMHDLSSPFLPSYELQHSLTSLMIRRSALVLSHDAVELHIFLEVGKQQPETGRRAVILSPWRTTISEWCNLGHSRLDEGRLWVGYGVKCGVHFSLLWDTLLSSLQFYCAWPCNESVNRYNNFCFHTLNNFYSKAAADEGWRKWKGKYKNSVVRHDPQRNKADEMTILFHFFIFFPFFLLKFHVVCASVAFVACGDAVMCTIWAKMIFIVIRTHKQPLGWRMKDMMSHQKHRTGLEIPDFLISEREVTVILWFW